MFENPEVEAVFNNLNERMQKLEDAIKPGDGKTILQKLEAHHDLVVSAIVAMQTKIGTDNSIDPTSLDFRITKLEEHVYNDEDLG